MTMNTHTQRIVSFAVLLTLTLPVAARGADADDKQIAQHAAAAEALIDELPAKAKKGLTRGTARRMLARAYGYAGLFDRMQALAGKMDEGNAHIIPARLPGFYAVHGQWNQAEQELEQLAREKSSALSLAWTLVIVQGMKQDISRTLALAARKAPDRKKRSAWIYATRQAVLNGDLRLAHGLSARAARQLPKDQRDATIDRINAWLEAGKLAAGARMPENKDKALVVRIGLIGWIWARNGRTALAERLAASLPSGYWRARILVALAETYQRAGNKLRCDRAQAEARQAIADIPDPPASVLRLRLDLALLQAADGDLPAALKTIGKAQEDAGEIFKKNARNSAAKQLQRFKAKAASARLEAMILANQLDTALAEIRKNPDALTADLLADLRQSLGRIGMTDQFDKILARVDDPARRFAYHTEMILRLSGKQPK
jgi:hypothetical protein